MMKNDIDQLRRIREQTLARIAEITAQPKPSYRIEGQQVEWADYLRRLQQTVDWCDAKLAAAAPFERRSRATT